MKRRRAVRARVLSAGGVPHRHGFGAASILSLSLRRVIMSSKMSRCHARRNSSENCKATSARPRGRRLGGEKAAWRLRHATLWRISSLKAGRRRPKRERTHRRKRNQYLAHHHRPVGVESMKANVWREKAILKVWRMASCEIEPMSVENA